MAPSTLRHAEETLGGGYGADQAENAPRIASLSVLCRFTGVSFVCFEFDGIDDGVVCTTFCIEWASMISVETDRKSVV